jgi:sulfonate transport system ATP-binding protein
MKPVLEVQGLVKAFGAVPVLGPLSLTLEAEGITAIIGRSGSGKSTLLRCLSGLERPSQGTVLFGGDPVRPDQVGFVFQEPRLMPWLSVRGNVAFGLRHLDKKTRERAIDLALDLVGLRDAGALLPKQLSGGMAQRVALARALAPEPKIVLLDEPLSALDPLTRERMQGHIRHVAQNYRATMVLITHDMDEALLLARRVVALQGPPGRIVGDWDLKLHESLGRFSRRREHSEFASTRAELAGALAVSVAD